MKGILGIQEKTGILGIVTAIEITSNKKRICIECGDTITYENDSGWERFTDIPGITQPVCIECDNKPIIKAMEYN